LIFQGVISNHRSQPIRVEWFGVRFEGNTLKGTSPLEELVAATGLDHATANPGGGLSADLVASLEGLRAPAVEAARTHMLTLRKGRAAEIGEGLRESLRKVKAWRDQRVENLELFERALQKKQGKLRKDQLRRLTSERDEAEKRYQKRRDWIDDAMRTMEVPFLRLVAIFVHDEAK
jgi:hypothetical protein